MTAFSTTTGLAQHSRGHVFLCRHGRTALNADGRLRGRLDPPLDDIGESEAEALAGDLWDRRIVKILTSPLLRALQTAAAVAQVAEVPAVAVDDLLDRDYGQWAGALESDVVAEYGSVDAAPGVEPRSAVAARAVALLESQWPALAHGDVVLVAHDAVNQALLAHLDSGLAGVRQRTGCWNEIRPVRGGWEVVRFDRVPDGDRADSTAPSADEEEEDA